MVVVRSGQDLILKAINYLVYPFISALIFLSIYLIPHWNTAIFVQNTATLKTLPGSHSLITTIWLMIPVMIFSFSHAPIISTFARSQKSKFGDEADKKSLKILKYSHLMMVITMMFFVVSCVLSLSPYDLAIAKQQNLPILSYLANHFDSPLIYYAGPIVALVAISKSFLGHYLGAKEGMQSLLLGAFKKINKKTINYTVELFILLTCWLVATLIPIFYA